jgi:hypothetical protein
VAIIGKMKPLTELLVVLLATPKTSPKMETVPSSIPKTMSPMESEKDFPIHCSSDLSGALFSESMILASHSSLLSGKSDSIYFAS